MTRTDEDAEKQQLWRSLSEAGLVDITLDDFPERVKEAKHAVMGRLSELLEMSNQLQERRSVAHSLGTLRKLEATLRDAAVSQGESGSETPGR
jgi:hypothetical protein